MTNSLTLNSRESILNNLRKAKAGGAVSDIQMPLSQSELDSSVFVKPSGDLIANFITELEKINGTCVVVSDVNSLVHSVNAIVIKEEIPKLLSLDETISDLFETSNIILEKDNHTFFECKASITGCEFLISRTGSIMVSNANNVGRKPHVFPDVHIVFAKASQMVADLDDAIAGITVRYKDKMPSWISVISGPSRTADIEKTLILGAHGPKKLYVIILKSSAS